MPQADFFTSAANSFHLGPPTHTVNELRESSSLLRERNRELLFLFRASQILASVLSPEQLPKVKAVIQELITLLEASKAFVWLVNEESADLECTYVVERHQKSSPLSSETLDARLARWVHKHGRSIHVPNVSVDNMIESLQLSASHHIAHSAIFAPMIVKDKILGVVELWDEQPSRFTASDVSLVEAFANSVAVTVENIRLYEKAQVLATMQERQRLAANLHDAINQSLFSANLIAEVLPRLWERNVDEGRRSLTDLRHLVRGATADLRGVLGELHPLMITDTDLATLLRQLSDAFTGRTNVPVSLIVLGQGNVPIQVQDTLYKLCHEALTNIAKHANASQVTIRLQYDGGSAQLHIKDDGRGFAPQHIPSGHFGLAIMRERVRAVDARLSVISTPGQGTEIIVRWMAKSESEITLH